MGEGMGGAGDRRGEGRCKEVREDKAGLEEERWGSGAREDRREVKGWGTGGREGKGWR